MNRVHSISLVRASPSDFALFESSDSCRGPRALDFPESLSVGGLVHEFAKVRDATESPCGAIKRIRVPFALGVRKPPYVSPNRRICFVDELVSNYAGRVGDAHGG
jgi:hypothetical protein